MTRWVSIVLLSALLQQADPETRIVNYLKANVRPGQAVTVADLTRVFKTPEEAATYGGTAGVAYDSCYHQACDTINNLSTKALAELGDAAVHATWTLAKTKGGLFEDNSRMAARQAISVDQCDYRGSQLIR